MFLELPVYINDVNLSHKNLNTENKRTALLDASMEDGLEPNSEQIKYTVIPYSWSAVYNIL
jgi:hypothetical protein